MRLSPSFLPAREPGVIGMLIGIISWPVHLVFALVEWFINEVAAPLISLPFQLWDAIWRHRKQARLQAGLRARARLERQREVLAIQTLRGPFVESLKLVDEFDRRQAQLDPQFLSSLQASRAICEAAMSFIPQVTTDPLIQAHLRESLSRVMLDDDE